MLLNITFLAFVSLVPLASMLLGMYPHLVITAVFYNMLLLINGILVLLVFFAANYKDRLMIPGDAKFRRKVLAFIRIMISIGIYAIATGIAFVNTYVSIVIALIMPLIEFLASFEIDLYVFVWKIIFKLVDMYKDKHQRQPAANLEPLTKENREKPSTC